MSESSFADNFDRVIGALHGLPEHEFSRPSTVTSVMPIIGRAQTYVVQTCRTPEGGYIGFLQMVDAEGRARIAIPAKVMNALYRQREGLVTRKRRATGKAVHERRLRDVGTG
jgi:hypothetical protein